MISGLHLATISSTFLAPEPPSGMSDSAVLTLMGGLMTSLGSFAPGPSAGTANFYAGIFTMLSAITSTSSPIEDLRFTSFATLSSEFGKALTAMQTRIKNYYRELLGGIPGKTVPPEYLEKLHSIIGSGTFADSDVTLDENVFNQTNQIQALQGGLINMLWREQRVFVVKIPKGRLVGITELNTGKSGKTDVFEYDPCAGIEAREHNDHLKSVLHCEGQDAYLIVSIRAARPI